MEAWAARAEVEMTPLSGRTPPALRAVLTEWPLVSATMAETMTGASRAAVQRNLAWMEARQLIREETGQGRYRILRIVEAREIERRSISGRPGKVSPRRFALALQEHEKTPVAEPAPFIGQIPQPSPQRFVRCALRFVGHHLAIHSGNLARSPEIDALLKRRSRISPVCPAV